MSSGPEKIRKQYRKEALRAMAPKDRLHLTYDLAWKAANAGNADRLLQLLLLLRKAIHVEENPLIALNALRLYRHCEWLVNEKHDFPAVSHIFAELKHALSVAVDHPDTPEFLARREKIRTTPGILYFGKHGRHFSPRPRGAKKSAGVSKPDSSDKNLAQ